MEAPLAKELAKAEDIIERLTDNSAVLLTENKVMAYGIIISDNASGFTRAYE